MPTRQEILDAARLHASAWGTEKEIEVARVSFIHAIQWYIDRVGSQFLLGKELKMKRIGLGLKLRQVEKETGVSNSYLSQLENCKINNPSFDVVTKLNIYYSSK